LFDYLAILHIKQAFYKLKYIDSTKVSTNGRVVNLGSLAENMMRRMVILRFRFTLRSGANKIKLTNTKGVQKYEQRNSDFLFD